VKEQASTLRCMYIACLVTLIGVRLIIKKASDHRVSFVFDVLLIISTATMCARRPFDGDQK